MLDRIMVKGGIINKYWEVVLKNILHVALVSVFTISLLTFSGISGPAYACPEGCEPPPDPEPEPKAKGNNGWGNGDQNAPGKSEFRNGAENNPGNGDHTGDAPGKSGH